MKENTLRARKKRKTRAALSRAAMELFAEQGFEATTVEEIALRVEVSRRTFFRYFETKEQAVFPNYEERLDSFREWLLPEVGEDGFACVSRACLAMGAEYMRNREELVLQQRVIHSSTSLWTYEMKLDHEWECMLAKSLETNPVTPLPPTQAWVVAGAIMGAIRATLRQWFEEEARGDLVAMGEETLSLLASRWSRETWDRKACRKT